MRAATPGTTAMFPLEQLYIGLSYGRAGSLKAHGVAALLVVLATALGLGLAPWLAGAQFSTFFPAVLLATVVCGIPAGCFAVALSTAAAWYFLLPTAPGFRVDEPPVALASLAFFVFVAGGEVMIVGALRAATVRTRDFNAALSGAFDANPDAMFVAGRDGRIVTLNARAAAVFDYEREALLGQSIDTLLPERSRARHAAHRRDFLGAPRLREMGVGLELFGRRRDGSEFPVDVQIGPFQLGRERCVIATVRDMTQHRAVAAALAESQRQQAVLEERQRGAEAAQRWADAFNSAAFGIVIGDAKSGTIQFANRAFAAMRDMTVAEVQGMSIADVYPADERQRIAALIARADSTGHVTYESRHLRKDGTSFPVQIDITSVRGADGIVAYRIASVLDITERKRTEEVLRQAQKMEAIGNVSGGVAHDFNNLLGIIIANLDLAAPLIGEQREAREMVDEALGAALRGAELTRRLLAFARRQPLRPTSVRPNELVSGVARLLRRVLGEHIEVSLDLAPDLWPVLVDPAQLEASIANLATNARDAMPKGGRLAIATANRRLDAIDAPPERGIAPGDYVMIEVADNGAGMTPAVLKRVFEPFFTTKEAGKGTGLGLSMVFGFARQSGGQVTVQSEPGSGTTFRLFLPRAAVEAAPAVPGDAEPAAASSGETVLVVEDNPGLRRVATRQLAGLGYRVLEAEGAKAALTVLEAEPVRLLFSDVVMPGEMDGFELARQAAERWPGLKVLLTSGFPGGKVDGEIEARLGSARLLSKPYRKQDLARAVRDVLDG